MTLKRNRKHSPKLKARVALDALRERETLPQLASKHQIHTSQVSKWKKIVLDGLPGLFETSGSGRDDGKEALIEQLYQQIGQLQVELQWLKKNAATIGADVRRGWVQPHSQMSLRRQCALVGVNRSTLYVEPRGESAENLKLMRLLDEQYTSEPSWGTRRMVWWLNSEKDCHVNRKRVQRLMRLMGIEAVYAKPKLSARHAEHRVYPYLLRGVPIVRPNQVWSTDITYVPMQRAHRVHHPVRHLFGQELNDLIHGRAIKPLAGKVHRERWRRDTNVVAATVEDLA